MSPRDANIRRLAWAFGLVATVMAVEAVAAVISGSLALLSDAGHMVTDAVGLGLAWAAATAADCIRAGRHRTYGLYRLEILAALGNALILLAVAAYVIYEAIQRITEPVAVDWQPMLIVGSVGLAANLISWAILRRGAKTSLNVEAAMLEVLADLWGSVGVVAAALVISVSGWTFVDPLVGVAIGLFILPRGWRLAARALRILVQAAPPHVDLRELRSDLEQIPGVVDVHDLHVWTLTSDMDVASVHLMIPDDCEPHPVLDRAQQIIKVDYGIGHATLQVEPTSHVSCRDVSC